MLGRLLLMDLRMNIYAFLPVVPAGIVTVLVFGAAMGPMAGTGIIPLTMFMVTWGYHTRLTYEDDKADTWVFLRALPIPAKQAVSVRFLSTMIALIAFTVIVALTAAALPQIAPRTTLPNSWSNVILAGIGGSLVLTALFNAIYFRFGYQAVASAMPYVFLVISAPALLVNSPLKNTDPVQVVAKAFGSVALWASAHPFLATGLVGATLLLLFAAGWAYSARALSRREFL